jgi:hypothetical protein
MPVGERSTATAARKASSHRLGCLEGHAQPLTRHTPQNGFPFPPEGILGGFLFQDGEKTRYFPVRKPRAPGAGSRLGGLPEGPDVGLADEINPSGSSAPA